MQNLKLKNSHTIMLFIVLAGCVTTKNIPSSFFIVKNELEGAMEIVVTPDRVLLECAKSDNEGRYGFMIHMLDEENTVTTALLSVRPDKKMCETHIKKINRMLKKSKRIYIGGHGTLSGNSRVENRKFTYLFPAHGIHYDNGRALQLGPIVDDKGECYNPMAWDYEPCLSYPFPIEKYKKQLKGER